MNDEKRIRAELLLDAIGEADDILLEAALEYKKPKPKLNTRVLAIAASFAVIFCILAGSSVLSRLSGIFDNSSGNEAETQPNDGDQPSKDDDMQSGGTEEQVEGSLDSVFDQLSGSQAYGYADDPGALPYFDGARIVWQYSGSDRYYYSRRLSEYDLWRIKGSLGRGEESGESSPSPNVKVWILLGDGRAVSPYLELSRGNISNGIFDYEVEIVPDEAFTRLIKSILT